MVVLGVRNHWSLFWNRGCGMGTRFKHTEHPCNSWKTIVIDGTWWNRSGCRERSGAFRERHYSSHSAELETLLHRCRVVVMVRQDHDLVDSVK